MKRIIFCTLLTGALLISCEKSGNDSQVGERLVKSVEITIPDEGMVTYDFRYNDKNKLSEMSEFYDGNEMAHSEYYYSDNTIIMRGDELEFVWKLNSRNQINQRTLNVGYGVTTTDYYYDSDGLLTYKEARYRNHDDNYSMKEKITYTRKDGNIITSTYFYNGNEEFKEYFTYTDNINKANLDLLAIVSMHFCEAGYPCGLYELDKTVFTSLGNRNLLRTYQYEDSDYVDVVNLSYDFDKDGYIVKIDAYYADDNELCVSAKVNYL